jgi:hypothetical protein
MDFGIVTAKVDEIGYITDAENLGFTHDPPLNRQYRVIEDFADSVMARL